MITYDRVYRPGSGPGKSHGVEHGTNTGYQYGCRCFECNTAWKEYYKSKRENLAFTLRVSMDDFLEFMVEPENQRVLGNAVHKMGSRQAFEDFKEAFSQITGDGSLRRLVNKKRKEKIEREQEKSNE